MKVGQKVRVLDSARLVGGRPWVGLVVKYLGSIYGFDGFLDRNGVTIHLRPEDYEIIPEETIEYYDEEPDKRFVVFYAAPDVGGLGDIANSFEDLQDAITYTKECCGHSFEIYDRIEGKEVKW